VPTNVFLTTTTNAEVDLVFVYLGPSDAYRDHFHQKQTWAPPDASGVHVMSIDRGGDVHVGDATGIGELQLWVAGVFTGALQVMLDNRTMPVKNAIYWNWRVPTVAEGRWTTSHEAHAISYASDAATVTLSVQGQGTIGFDDIHVTLFAEVASFTSLAAVRDEQRGRLVAFATDTRGCGTVATAPLVPPGPAEIAWTPSTAVSDGTLAGDAAVLTGWTFSVPGWIAARTQDGGLWIRDVDGTGATTVPLDAPATVVAVTFSDLWEQAKGIPAADVFLTAGAPGSLRLYHRVLLLAPVVELRGRWQDWGAVLAPPGYTTSLTRRYLFAAQPGGILSSAAIQCCTASLWAADWGMWHGTWALPRGVTPVAVTASTRWFDGKPQEPAAAIFTGDDGSVNWLSLDVVIPGWRRAASGFRGPVLATPASNVCQVLGRGPGGLTPGQIWPKESIMEFSRPDPGSAAVRAFAPVNPYVPAAIVKAPRFAVVLQSDVACAPASRELTIAEGPPPD
jgi:hypothetical protein